MEDSVRERIRGEFLEMPGLRLTEAQAIRLMGLDSQKGGEMLTHLVKTEFLHQTRDGAYMMRASAVRSR